MLVKGGDNWKHETETLFGQILCDFMPSFLGECGFVEWAQTWESCWLGFCLAIISPRRSSVPWVQLPEHVGGSPHLMLNPGLWASGPHILLPTKQSPLDVPQIPPLTCPKLIALHSKTLASYPFLVQRPLAAQCPVSERWAVPKGILLALFFQHILPPPPPPPPNLLPLWSQTGLSRSMTLICTEESQWFFPFRYNEAASGSWADSLSPLQKVPQKNQRILGQKGTSRRVYFIQFLHYADESTDTE